MGSDIGGRQQDYLRLVEGSLDLPVNVRGVRNRRVRDINFLLNIVTVDKVQPLPT